MCRFSAPPEELRENDIMREDPIGAEVRRTREDLSARFDFEVKALFADLRNRQAALGGRLVSRKKRAEAADAVDRESRSTPVVVSDSNTSVPGT